MTVSLKIMLADIISQNDDIQALTVGDDLNVILSAYNRLKGLFGKYLGNNPNTIEHRQAWAMIDLFAFTAYQDMVYYKVTEAGEDYRVAFIRFKDRINQAVSLLL